MTACSSKPKEELAKEIHEIAKAVEDPAAKVRGNDALLDHKYFKVSYNIPYRIPNWVSYELTAENLKIKKAKKQEKFRVDASIKNLGLQTVQPADYSRTGFLKGLLAPVEDFARSQKAHDSIYTMSNVAPMLENFKKTSWTTLERTVRGWACTEKKILVITGPIITKKLQRMKARIAVPEKFFKIILDETPPRKAIAFIYGQNDSKISPAARTVSVEKVETLTGQKFLMDLSAADQAIKKSFNYKAWKESNCFKSSKQASTM